MLILLSPGLTNRLTPASQPESSPRSNACEAFGSGTDLPALNSLERLGRRQVPSPSESMGFGQIFASSWMLVVYLYFTQASV